MSWSLGRDPDATPCYRWVLEHPDQGVHFFPTKREALAFLIDRHESYRGRTTPEITWRVWNPDRTTYAEFKTRREALAYLEVG